MIDLQKYRTARKHGSRAKDAIRWARMPAQPFDGWSPGDPPCAWSQDGFDLVLTAEYDECPDHSWIGEYSNDWRPGCVDTYHGEDGRSCRSHYRYFHPATEYRHQDYAMMRKVNSGDMGCYVVSVSARKNGVLLGTACIGGVYHEYGEDYTPSYEHDMVSEAIAEARATLQGLCA